jgi:DNA-binding transcriptional MerR regulator
MERLSTQGPERKNILIRALLGDRFFINFATISDSEGCKKFLRHIRLRDHFVQNTVSCRVLNHWELQGLLECERNNESGWRKFNLIEHLWLRIIQKLREIGLPLAKIVQIKPFYFEMYNNDDEIAFADYYITIAQIFKLPVFFVILLDENQAEFLDYHEFQAAMTRQCLGSYLSINLNDLLNQVFVKKVKPIYPITRPLSPNLAEAINVLEDEEFDVATIQKKGRNIQKVELDKHFDEKISDRRILEDYDNVDLIKKKRKGEVVSKKRKVIKELML